MLKVRVKHFCGHAYVVEVATPWFFGLFHTWSPIYTALDILDEPTRHQPMLFFDFDDAVRYAESLTIEKLSAHNDAEDKKFANMCRVRDGENALRSRVWYSE